MRVLTLLTDFGLRDHYTAAVKGVILGLAPPTTIVDITHEVPPGDVAVATFLLAAAWPSFSPGTVHLAIVDPGVGSERDLLVATRSDGTAFVAPDNGLLGELLDSCQVIRVTRSEIFRPGAGATFHGRDRFAPIAAALLRGEPAASLGEPAPAPLRLAARAPRREAAALHGRVAHVDHYGNVITDIPSAWLPPGPCRAAIGDHHTDRRASHYAELPDGEPAILPGSLGTLELAVRGASLAREWQVRRDDPVVVVVG